MKTVTTGKKPVKRIPRAQREGKPLKTAAAIPPAVQSAEVANIKLQAFTGPKDDPTLRFWDQNDVRFWGIEFHHLLFAMRRHLPYRHPVRMYFEAVQQQFNEDEIAHSEQPARACVEMAHRELSPVEWWKVWEGWHKSQNVPTREKVHLQNRVAARSEPAERITVDDFGNDGVYVHRYFDASEHGLDPVRITIAVGTTKEKVMQELSKLRHAIDNEWEDLITIEDEGISSLARRDRGVA